MSQDYFTFQSIPSNRLEGKIINLKTILKIIPIFAICAISFGCTSTTPKKCTPPPTPDAP